MTNDHASFNLQKSQRVGHHHQSGNITNGRHDRLLRRSTFDVITSNVAVLQLSTQFGRINRRLNQINHNTFLLLSPRIIAAMMDQIAMVVSAMVG